MSATSHERKPSVTNWFSSLRRQPKPNKKKLQKSCVDLPSIAIASNDIKSLPASVTNSPKIKNGFFNRDNNFPFFAKYTSSASPLAAVASTTHQSSIDELSTLPMTTMNNTKKSEKIHVNPDTGKIISSKKVTTITKVTKTTVIKQNQNHRSGMVFDDNGALITCLDAYQNFANNFKSNLIKNDSCGSSCSSGSVHQSMNSINLANKSPNAKTFIILNGNSSNNDSVSDGYSGIVTNGSGNVCDHNLYKKSASNSSLNQSRPFKSNSLEDDIEFIDSSSSLSDIGSSRVDLYYNTLPKSCATCKTQVKSKSDWNISMKKKVQTERQSHKITEFFFFRLLFCFLQ